MVEYDDLIHVPECLLSDPQATILVALNSETQASQTSSMKMID